jgi:hypothetical protein
VESLRTVHCNRESAHLNSNADIFPDENSFTNDDPYTNLNPYTCAFSNVDGYSDTAPNPDANANAYPSTDLHPKANLDPAAHRYSLADSDRSEVLISEVLIDGPNLDAVDMARCVKMMSNFCG